MLPACGPLEMVAFVYCSQYQIHYISIYSKSFNAVDYSVLLAVDYSVLLAVDCSVLLAHPVQTIFRVITCACGVSMKNIFPLDSHF